jgi:hypothetical protein
MTGISVVRRGKVSSGTISATFPNMAVLQSLKAEIIRAL